MNLDKLMDSLNFAFRQKDAVYRIFDLAKGLFRGGFSFKRIVSSFLIIAELFGSLLFDTPVKPYGQELDLTGYEIVFEDEFNGDALDADKWEARGNGPRRYGYNASSQIEVKDGSMLIKGEYLEDGQYGAGWYVGAVHLKERYVRGYYEIRCKCNAGKEFWSAFWLQHGNAYVHDKSQGGVHGAEIDIFESLTMNKKEKNGVSTTIHCNGWDDDVEHIDSRLLGKFKGNNITEEYNTYGLKWTEDEYIFYINGVETCRSSFGNGVSTEPEEVIVSLEIPDLVTYEHDFATQMQVDYVKIYQLSAD